MKQLFLKTVDLVEGYNDIDLDSIIAETEKELKSKHGDGVRLVQKAYGANTISLYFIVSDSPGLQSEAFAAQ